MSDQTILLAQSADASNADDRLSVLAERLTDRMNPILVKEVRQALKSRQFVVTFMLLLVIAWLVSAGAAIFSPNAMEFGSAGNQLFLIYFGILAFAVIVIVPFGAHRSMLAERDQNTFELLSISALTPRQIVNGKLLSAMVQSFVYYSAVTPFIAFASLLQGFDLPLSLFLLAIAFGWSICVSMFALMLSTLAQKRQIQAANSMGMFFLLMFQLYMTAGILFQFSYAGVPFDDPAFWWTVGCVVVAAGSYTLLAQQVAVSRLTFESGNRSSGTRLILAAQFWLFCGAVVANSLWTGLSISSRDASELLIFVAFHWTIAGTYAATEVDWLSRRLRRQLPRNVLLRFLFVPWMPGGARGLLWMLLHGSAILAAAFLFDWDANWFPTFVLATCCYMVFLTALGGAMTRWLRLVTPSFRPAHGRALILIFTVAISVTPLIARALSPNPISERFHMIDLASPFMTLPRLIDGRMAIPVNDPLRNQILIALCAAAALAVLANGRAILNGISEVVSRKPDEPLDAGLQALPPASSPPQSDR